MAKILLSRNKVEFALKIINQYFINGGATNKEIDQLRIRLAKLQTSKFKPQFAAQNYLFVKQGHISCWEYNSEKSFEFGFYTEKFYNCIIILLKSNHNSKISMIHADSGVASQDVQDMIQWIGEDAEKIIYYKNCNDAKETITNLFGKDAFQQKIFKFIPIEPLRKDNYKILYDESLPQSLKVPEFEFSVIWIDYESNFGQRYHSEIVEMTDDDRIIQKLYLEHQPPESQSFANKVGSLYINDEEFKTQTRNLLDSQEMLLWQLVCSGDYGNVRGLLDNPIIDIDRRLSNGYTILAGAAVEGQEKIVNLILSRGASVDIPIILENGKFGGTPLFLASGRGHINIVQMLLSVGADINYKTSAGITAKEIALRQNHSNVVMLLQEYRLAIISTKNM